MRPLSRICLPGSTAHFQPLFTTLSGSFIKSRLYNRHLKNNTIIPISSNYNAIWQICLIIIFVTLYFYRLRYFDLAARAELSIKVQYRMDDFYFEGGHPSRHMELKAFTRSFHAHLALCQLLVLCTSSQTPQPTLSIFSFYSLLS